MRARVILGRFVFRTLEVEFLQISWKCEAKSSKVSPLAPSALANTFSVLFRVGSMPKSHAFASARFWSVFEKSPDTYNKGQVSFSFLYIWSKNSQIFSARAFGARECLFPLPCWERAKVTHSRARDSGTLSKSCLFRTLTVEILHFFLLHLKQNLRICSARAFGAREYLFALLYRGRTHFWGCVQKSHIRDRVIQERFQKAACFVHERPNSFNFLVKCEGKPPKISSLAPLARANTFFLLCWRRAQASCIRERVILVRFQKATFCAH